MNLRTRERELNLELKTYHLKTIKNQKAINKFEALRKKMQGGENVSLCNGNGIQFNLKKTSERIKEFIPIKTFK